MPSVFALAHLLHSTSGTGRNHNPATEQKHTRRRRQRHAEIASGATFSTGNSNTEETPQISRTVRPVPEIHVVQIRAQDRRLRQAPLEQQRPCELCGLPGDCAAVA